MRVCYFASEYPSVSHTFIRREIVELERNDIAVFRVSLRRNTRNLVDTADLEEKARTKYVFDASILEFARAFVGAFAVRPSASLNAVWGALRMMKRSSRPIVFHLFYLAEALVIAQWLLKRKVQHIHAHFGTNGAEVAMLTHLLTGIPYSFTVHGPDEFDKPEYLGLAEKARYASFICVISSFTGSQMRRWMAPQMWRKLKLVRCGLDSQFSIQHQATKISSDHLISIGRLSGQKGQLLLLDALRLVADQNVPFRMTIAGDGPLRPELERRIRELGLHERVRIAGWLTNSEIRNLIKDARALVLPSLAEGLPVVLMEALALGRPVITTYVGGIPELVTNGVCGWLVPPGDVEQLSHAIRECLTAPNSRLQAMGRVGRRRVVDMHDIVRECRKLSDLFAGREVPELSMASNSRQPAVHHHTARSTKAVEPGPTSERLHSTQNNLHTNSRFQGAQRADSDATDGKEVML
jgi:colanic acid/amylovoran biosynthesis glycosyltransferase